MPNLKERTKILKNYTHKNRARRLVVLKVYWEIPISLSYVFSRPYNFYEYSRGCDLPSVKNFNLSSL